MPYITLRPLSEAEFQVLRSALSAAPVGESAVHTEQELRSLVVHSVCKCGCASVGFLPEGVAAKKGTHVIADGLGLSSAKEQVGILVYGSPGQIVELEVHWPYAEPSPLPSPESVVPWERGEEVRNQEVPRSGA